MLKNLSFLFGSGISIKANMPSVCEITKRVLSGTEVMRHTNGSYAFGPGLYAHWNIPDEYVPRVVEFLKILSKKIEEQDSPEHKSNVNYEHLYYVAAQIRDSESGEYDNPIVPAFIEKIMSEIKPLLLGKMPDMQWNKHKISEEATHYIHDIVWHFLKNTEPANLDYLHCLKDTCQDEKVSKVNLFTLNNDTVVEQYLDACRIKYSDGFGQPINDVRYWSPEVYKDPSNKVRLYKLHGSVDWFRFKPHIGNNPLIGIPLNGDPWHSNNQENQLQAPIDGRPMLLAGTFNKMLQYTSGIYADLYCQMYSALQETETFIVCGYGFKDKGINSRLIEWLNSSEQHRMVVIHAEPEKLQKEARDAISKNWNYWLQNKKLVLVQKWIECASWEEVLSALGA